MVALPFAVAISTRPRALPNLAVALVRNGHDVSYVNAEDFRETIENTGAEFIPYINFNLFLKKQERKWIEYSQTMNLH